MTDEALYLVKIPGANANKCKLKNCFTFHPGEVDDLCISCDEESVVIEENKL